MLNVYFWIWIASPNVARATLSILGWMVSYLFGCLLLGSDASLVDVRFGMDDRWWVSGVISCTLAVLFLTSCPDPMMLDLWSMIEHSDFD